jgi:hypothetical protein
VVNAATNAVVFTDTNVTVTNRGATSLLDSVDSLTRLPIPLPAGTYKVVATGTAVRDVSFDVSLGFVGQVSSAPEPEAVIMLAMGLATLALVSRRRRPG